MKVFPEAAFALHSPCWMESQRNRLWFGGHCLCMLSKVLLDFRSLSYCRSDICEIFLISVHLCRQSSRISHSLMLRAWNVCQANTNCAHNGTISSPYCILKGETSHLKALLWSLVQKAVESLEQVEVSKHIHS